MTHVEMDHAVTELDSDKSPVGKQRATLRRQSAKSELIPNNQT